MAAVPGQHSYQDFLDRIDTIATKWGLNELHNDGTWSTTSWSDHWKATFTETQWLSGGLNGWRYVEEVLRMSKDMKGVDIYDRWFPSVERVLILGFGTRLLLAGYISSSWLRQQTRKHLLRLAINYRNGLTRKSLNDQAKRRLATVALERLESARETTNPKYQERNRVAQADYVTWAKAIKTHSESLDVSSLRVIAILWALEKVVNQTFDKAEALGVVTRLLLYSYLPDTATFLKWCQKDLEVSIQKEKKAEQKEVQKRKRENETSEPVHGHSSTTTVAAAHSPDLHGPYSPVHRRDEGVHSGNAPKRHSSFSQSSLARPLPAPLPNLPSSYNANTPSSPTSQIFASPEPSPTFFDNHALASSTHSLPAGPRQPWRRTSSSHSLIEYPQYGDSGSSELATSFASDHSPNSVHFARNRNHSSSSNPSNPFVFTGPPFPSLRRTSTASRSSTHGDAQESAIEGSPSFSPLPASFNQQMPPPSSFTLPPSAYTSSIYPSSSRYSPARRPSNTVTRPFNLRRQSMVNAFSPTNLAQPEASAESESTEVLVSAIVGKYTEIDKDWGREVRTQLTQLLRDLETKEHSQSAARNSVVDYLKWLKGVPLLKFLPTPLELPTCVEDVHHCIEISSLAVRRFPTFGAPR